MNSVLMEFLFKHVAPGAVSGISITNDISLNNQSYFSQSLTTTQANQVGESLNVTGLQIKNHLNAMKLVWRKAVKLQAGSRGEELVETPNLMDTMWPNLNQLNEYFSSRDRTDDFHISPWHDDQSSTSIPDSPATAREDSVTVPPIRSAATTTPRVPPPALTRPVVTEDPNGNRLAREDDFANLRKRKAPPVSQEVSRPVFRALQKFRPKLPVSGPMAQSKREEMMLAAKLKKEEMLLAAELKREEMMLAAELKREEMMLAAELMKRKENE